MTDWNDVFVDQGADAVVAQMKEQLQPEPTPVAEPSQGVKDPEWVSKLLTNREGVKATLRNIVLMLRNTDEWDGVLGYCEFSYRIIKRKPPPCGGRTGEWENVDTLHLKDWLGEHHAITPTNHEIDDAVLMIAKDNAFHPIREYLSALQWDGKERLNHWLRDALEADGESEYLAAVGRKFLLGAVARIMRPPVKMDNVLILEGNQGRGKSTLVRVLFNNWYSETSFDIGAKDGYQHIQGIWGVELPELDSFNKAESTAAKSFFTALTDRFRPPYGRNMEEFARQCVFIGTTNQDQYLKDYSGNRRYWPVYCNKVDVGIIERDRDQLWAEAMYLLNEGDPWWVEADSEESELFIKHQDRRMLGDPWDALISEWLDDVGQLQTDFFTASTIITSACKKDPGHQTRQDEMRIAPIMKSLGWIPTRKRITEDGSTQKRMVRGYKRPPRPAGDF